MPNLTNLDVEWVSLVDRAAVRDPVEQSEPMRFLIWKRDTDPSKGGRPMKLTKEMVDQLGDRVEKADDLTKLVEKSDNAEQAGLALDGAARLLAAHKSDLPPDVLVELAKAAGVDLQLEKAGPKFGTPEWDEKYGVGSKKKPSESEPKSAAELVASLKKSDMDPAIVTEVESALAKAAEKDDLAKADPALRARIEKAEGETKEALDLAKAERDTRLTKEFVAKADGFEGLSLDADKFGPVLKEASEKLSKESYAELERVLKGADEGIVASDLFKEQGREGAGAGGDAMQELLTKADEIRKADSKLSQAEALDKAATDNPELQKRYLDEVRG